MDGRRHDDTIARNARRRGRWKSRRRRAAAERERRRMERLRQESLRIVASLAVAVIMFLPAVLAARHGQAPPQPSQRRAVAGSGSVAWCVDGMGRATTFASTASVMDTRPRPLAWTAETGAAGGCGRTLSWPLRHVDRRQAFDGPAQPWLAGHRGVDLAAGEHDELLAPADGVVTFTGTVAGKQVVSIRHRDLTLTFEPAVTALDTGAQVVRDEPFGEVGAHSDHCDGACLHWGVRRGDDYLDPEALAEPRRIALKPVVREGSGEARTR
ncbi:M23 family metallopeptidase [Bifidobacterium parmae]|uniref:Peptidase, M23 family n=1 Tax=Bifidobacterium parmae TaxID=361854 RepID=A0A2N5IZ69_9BIFI|nr:M23 family metallopeptidase [Bifidobacterium parmae]PLS27258.1 peptidase, M23 family [Bifidobacterium parmae]